MTTNEPLMTVNELAAFLGVPTTTIYAWRTRGEGPRGLRVGRYVRFRKADVDQWVSQQIETNHHE